MVDEVQTGLGRTGRWFGHQHFGVVPDVVTMAKALGNGVPIGACWARAEVAAAFEPGDHATTYGGQPLATAAARAVLAEMEAEDVPGPGRAGRRAAHRRRSRRSPGVAAVRGLGLLLAAELDGGSTPRRSPPTRSTPGSSSTRSRPTALRLAPSLTRHRRRDRRGRRRSSARCSPGGGIVIRHFLEIDDLTPDELAEVLDLAERADPAAGAGGPGRRPCCSRSRRCAPATRPRWRSCSSAATRSRCGADEIGLDDRETAEDVARTLAGYHAAIGARVFEHADARAHGGAPARVPVVNLLSDDSHPLPGARRPAHDPAGVRSARRPAPSPGSATSTTSPARSRSAAALPRHARSASPARRATARPTPTSTACGRVGAPTSRSRPYADEAVKGADVVHTDVWYVDGPGGRGRGAPPGLRGLHRRRRAARAGGASGAIFLHCLPAHRGEEVAADGARRAAQPGLRAGRTTACTPPAALLAFLLDGSRA